MKKSLILLPLTAALLSSCFLMPSKKTSKTSGSSSSGSGSGSDQPTVEPVPTEAADFVFTSGEHTATLDFKNSSDNYKKDFPYVEKDTGKFTGTTGGLDFTAVSCFVSAYSGEGYMMMQNKKNNESWSETNGNAFFASAKSLGAITSISFVCGTSASTAQSYVITLSKTPIDSAQSTSENIIGHPGNASKPVTASVSDGYSYFAISTKDGGRNGQIGTLTITYTIS